MAHSSAYVSIQRQPTRWPHTRPGWWWDALLHFHFSIVRVFEKANKYQFSRAKNNNNIYSETFGRFVSTVFCCCPSALADWLAVWFHFSCASSPGNFTTAKLTGSFGIGNVFIRRAQSMPSKSSIVWCASSVSNRLRRVHDCHMWIYVVRRYDTGRTRTETTHFRSEKTNTHLVHSAMTMTWLMINAMFKMKLRQ